MEKERGKMIEAMVNSYRQGIAKLLSGTQNADEQGA